MNETIAIIFAIIFVGLVLYFIFKDPEPVSKIIPSGTPTPAPNTSPQKFPSASQEER